MGMLLLCVLFTWSEHPECVSVFYLSCPGQFLSVFVPGCFKRDLGSIHYKFITEFVKSRFSPWEVSVGESAPEST